jgi:hypothetical protein
VSQVSTAGEAHVVVPYDRLNSTVRTRALHWIDRLEASGTIRGGQVVVHGPGFGRHALEAGSPTLLLRNASRLTRGGREARLLRDASLGVYDLDDGLPWDDGTLPGLGRWWKRPFPRSLVARRAASAADRVVAGNDTIAEWASSLCGDVVVVPTCVEPAEYARRTSWAIVGDPVIGWIGSPATEHYLGDITEALVEVHRRTGARVEIVSGAGSVPATIADFATRRTWTADAVSWISGWDVGLMPLRDGVYERAKCGYKLLQYAAAGVPAVGSPVGVNRQMLAAMDGLAPESMADWVEAICATVSEPESVRGERARRGFDLAQRYSYETWETRWREAVGW